jgi:hypothetical protein
MADADLHALYEAINSEIRRLFGDCFVLTFVDARRAPLTLSFCDRDGSRMIPTHNERLTDRFMDFRRAVRTQPDSQMLAVRPSSNVWYEDDNVGVLRR